MDKKKILIVDDELMILYSLRRMLEDDYEITIAHGAKAAIDIINQAGVQFDLIITDVNMPDVNGVNFYLDLEKNHPGLEKRVIFMTGGPLSVYLDDFFAKCNAPQLAKPFEYTHLCQVIEDFLGSSAK